MVGPVDFEKDAGYWQQDRWSGQFPVKWHIVKDIPNNRFCHILLQNNDNKPVTHSRDSQEVGLTLSVVLPSVVLRSFIHCCLGIGAIVVCVCSQVLGIIYPALIGKSLEAKYEGHESSASLVSQGIRLMGM